jgi:hypothetical protein
MAGKKKPKSKAKLKRKFAYVKLYEKKQTGTASGRLLDSGTWTNGSGLVTIPDMNVTDAPWQGSGTWNGTIWSDDSITFHLAGVSWQGSGTVDLPPGQGGTVTWDPGSGEAWNGSGPVSTMVGEGTFTGTILGHDCYGTWEATIGISSGGAAAAKKRLRKGSKKRPKKRK